MKSPQKVFISAVSAEFARARSQIRSDLAAKGYMVRVQDDFTQSGSADTILARLDEYIAECQRVVFIVGDYSGGFPTADEAKPYLDALPPPFTRASYTQLEYFLARRHGCETFFFKRSAAFKPDRPAAADDEAASQSNYVKFLFDGNHHFYGPGEFTTADELSRHVLKIDWPVQKIRKPFNLPRATLGHLFKGRTDEMAKLRAALTAKSSAAIVEAGLGGVGKTRLALEYGHAHSDEYSALLFVEADTPDKLRANIAALTGPMVLNLDAQHAKEDEVKVAAALDWLREQTGWYLILDNVDTPEAQKAATELLTHLAKGQVVITSRLQKWHNSVTRLDLGVLLPDAARDLLLEATQDRRKAADDAVQAAAVAERLGYLALALEQAAAYINARGIGITQYLKDWDASDAAVEFYDEDTILYRTSVAKTWATSFAQLSGGGRALLQMLAWFAPDPIPDFLFDGKWPTVEGWETHDLTSAQAELVKYGMATRTDDGGVLVHRVVQDVTRRGKLGGEKALALKAALKLLIGAWQGHPDDVRSWPRLDPLTPHAETLSGYSSQNDFEDGSKILNGLGQIFGAKAQYQKAEAHYRRALVHCEKSFGTEHLNTAKTLNNLAGLFRTTNRLADADAFFRRALAIVEESLGLDHPIVATCLNNLAGLRHATNHLAEAEPMYRRALAIDEKSLGSDHPDVARDLSNLARLLQDTNRLAEAEPLYRRALAIGERTLGPEHPNVAIRLNNLAGLLKDTNRFAEAEPMFRRALAIDEKSFGPHHPSVASSLNNLADLLQDTSRLPEAEPLFRRALAIFEKSLGSEHPNVATSLNNLALLLRATNRLAEVEPLFWRALAIVEKSLGSEHPNVATSLNNLALLLEATNRPAEAEPLYRRGLVILFKFMAATGHQHPHLEAVFGNYARCLEALGRGEAEIKAEIAAVKREAGLEG